MAPRAPKFGGAIVDSPISILDIAGLQVPYTLKALYFLVRLGSRPNDLGEKHGLKMAEAHVYACSFCMWMNS